MTAATLEARPIRHATAEPSAFCAEVFDSMPRADQRRWAEVYVLGLLRVPGRKSIRRICEHVLGVPADQCLQQFLNQSPWQWEPVRRALAFRAADTRPGALVVEDVVFPKTGSSSVGVDRQAAPHTGRTVNCQLGLVCFLVNQDACHAVNWRLMLPRSWDTDDGRRTRARLPVSERHGPRWRNVLALVDETAVGWGLASVPVVLDAGADGAAPLLAGLRERELRYLVRVSTGPEDTPVGARYTVRPGHAPGGRQVLAEWTPGGRHPRTVWLTNLAAPLRELVELVAAARGVRRHELPRLRDDFGMEHFEGRSFAGWHHHLTLVSVAHAIWAGHDR